jgi:hypothetical protein
LETEAEILRYVRERFNTLVPEIVYNWVDRASSRSFLILNQFGGDSTTSIGLIITLPAQICCSIDDSILRDSRRGNIG